MTGRGQRVWMITAGALIGAAVAAFLAAPGVESLERAPFSLVIEDRGGALLGARVAADGQWRFPFTHHVPPKFAAAIIAQEDRRFRMHPGVDPLAILRAAYQNIRSRKVVSGASTITMQVIRLSRRGKTRSIGQKVIEVFSALKLELVTRKSTILAHYAAHAPFGGNVVGVEAASWRYFNRPPSLLSWAEAATLAVLPNEPGLVHPGRNRARLRAKRDRLLRMLRDRRVIDSMEYALAIEEPLAQSVHALPRIAPHLLDRIARERAHQFGSRRRVRDARVTTTIDAGLQQRVNGIISRHATALQSNGIHNAAALVVSVTANEVLAYVGNAPAGADSLRAMHVDCIRAPRSTGSVLKPFLYAAMLDAGEVLPGMLIPDIPTSIGGFAPQNFNREYEGAVPASMALARSLNVPAVRMLMRFGVSRFHRTLQRLGMTTVTRSPDNYGISLILGGAEGTLWELTGIYASMARCVNAFARDDPAKQSRLVLSMPVLTVQSFRNAAETMAQMPFSAGACWCALDAMKEVVRPGEEAGWQEFLSSRRVAWKTGTSFGFRDGWAIGVTPTHAVGVWVGNASGEGRPGLIGIVAAAPALFEIFGVLPPSKWFDIPEADLRRVAVCRQSGYLPGQDCCDIDTVWAPEAALRASSCPYHCMVHLSADGQWRVNDACERVDAMQHRPWFLLPPVIESYYHHRHPDYALLPPWRPRCARSADNPIGLIYPSENAAVYVPREVSGDRGRVVFEATHRIPQQTIFWHLDEEYLGSSSAIHQMAANPSPGQHLLVLVDTEGNRIERRITVLTKEGKRQ